MSEKPTQGSKVDARVRGLLACPACHGELRQDVQRLVCVTCGRGYPIVDGIPVLTPQA